MPSSQAASAFRQAAPVIDAADARAEPRQQRAGADLLLAPAAGHRPEQVRGAELAVLARIEQGEFLPVGEPGVQGLCVDAFHGICRVEVCRSLGTGVAAWQRTGAGAHAAHGRDAGVRPRRRAPPPRPRGGDGGARGRRAARRGGTAARPAGRHDARASTRRWTSAAAAWWRRCCASAASTVVSCDLSPAMAARNGGPVRRGGRGIPAVRPRQLRPGRGEPVAALGQRPARRADPVAAGAAAGRAAAGQPAGARHAGRAAPRADRGRGGADRRRLAARVAVPRPARLRRAAATRRLRAAGGGRGG